MVKLSVLLLLIAAASAVSSPAQFSPFALEDFCSHAITLTCNTTFAHIDQLNEDIRPHIRKLVQTPYFRYFKLNFDKQCKFWDAQHFCATKNCAVEILPAEQYNWLKIENQESLNAQKLGEINKHTGEDTDPQAGTCEDLDYCEIDDDHNCDYVDLLQNPERFTGYGGSQLLDVWKAIYLENCFPNTNPMSMKEGASSEQCVEKNLFYRVISGMHASIAVHLANEYLSPDLEEFEANLSLFMERVGYHNERLLNIYFNYALISQLIIKLLEIFSGALVDHIVCGEVAQNSKEPRLLGNDEPDYKQVFGGILPALSEHTLFDTSKLFDPSVVSPELKNEFRSRFRNVSAIMDCVGCDRCRMWGKLQTIGYGTALKILFDGDNTSVQFRRIELVALFNTFDRLSKSIEAINNFKNMYIQHLEDVKNGLTLPGEFESFEQKKGLKFPFRLFNIPKKSVQNSGLKVQEERPETSSEEKKDTKEDTSQTNRFLKVTKVPSRKRTLRQEWDLAFDEFKNATIFVLTSYKNLPRNLWHLSLTFLNQWWNQFSGRKVAYEQVMIENYHDENAYEKLFVDNV